ncbi:hypothetical protein [uncultured Veillonella sp.]|uniref:hypothetical protein n=1 Tax=uncultured Veillonella sp. TaxID=159268 RepID=UPI002601C1A4|nr:hypothetical protein [uncultured Veillonella sp.]
MTKFDELSQLARRFGIDEDTFTKAYNSEETFKALMEDITWRVNLGIYSLPSYLIEYKNKQIIVSGVFSYEEFLPYIETLTEGIVQPKAVPFSKEQLQAILQKHPHSHYYELNAAFDLDSIEPLDDVLQSWAREGFITKDSIKDSYFIRLRQ